MFNALSPLDGRYEKDTEVLRNYFSEFALMRTRVFVEISYFVHLSKTLKFKVSNEKSLRKIVSNFNASEFKKIKRIESRTRHDMKAVEYYLRERIKKHGEFIHFGLTSDDVNNLAYGILVHDALKNVLAPALCTFLNTLNNLAGATSKTTLLGFTHGQPATPTTLGKEMSVFTSRLHRQLTQLSTFRMHGKMGGAVGNLAAHYAAYPKVRWESFRNRFVSELGLLPLTYTTQINPHDDLAELSHLFIRINTILLDFSRDMWMYIFRGVFRQNVVKHEVGSSTMPHKVNPIDFENAEGNLGLSNALFSHFAEKLPVSRLQRDLSDSTVMRNIGVAFGHHLLAVSSLKKGLSRLSTDRKTIEDELSHHPEVLAEALQTILRRYGHATAYEQLKTLTCGTAVSRQDLAAFIGSLKLSSEAIKHVQTYIQNWY